MEVIELHRPFLYRQPPNIFLYTILYSFTQGFFWILIDHLWDLCQSHSQHSKVIIVGTIVLTKLPISIYYFVKTIRNRGNENNQESAKTQPKLLFKYLIIPTIFRILLYVVVLLVLEIGKTYYMAIGFIPNLIIGQILFEYNSTQTDTNLVSRVIGVFLISIGAIVGVTDSYYYVNPSLYLIFLATSIFVIHGEIYLNSKILKLYKPTKAELIAKYFVTEVIMYSGSYLISVFLQYMQIINQGISITEFIQYLFSQPLFLGFSIIWIIIFGSLLHLIYFALLEVSTSSQYVYFISFSLVWYQLYSLISVFRWNIFWTVALGLLSGMFYVPSARIQLERIVVYIAKRNQQYDDD